MQYDNEIIIKYLIKNTFFLVLVILVQSLIISSGSKEQEAEK